MSEKNMHISAVAPVIRELVESGKTVEIMPQGISMRPSIVSGDVVTLTKAEFPLKKYDLAFYVRCDGSVVLHRVVCRKKGAYVMVGDAQDAVEYPVYEKDIVAVAKSVVRSGEVVETLGHGKSSYTAKHHRHLFCLKVRRKLGAIYRKIFKK